MDDKKEETSSNSSPPVPENCIAAAWQDYQANVIKYTLISWATFLATFMGVSFSVVLIQICIFAYLYLADQSSANKDQKTDSPDQVVDSANLPQNPPPVNGVPEIVVERDLISFVREMVNANWTHLTAETNQSPTGQSSSIYHYCKAYLAQQEGIQKKIEVDELRLDQSELQVTAMRVGFDDQFVVINTEVSYDSESAFAKCKFIRKLRIQKIKFTAWLQIRLRKQSFWLAQSWPTSIAAEIKLLRLPNYSFELNTFKTLKKIPLMNLESLIREGVVLNVMRQRIDKIMQYYVSNSYHLNFTFKFNPSGVLQLPGETVRVLAIGLDVDSKAKHQNASKSSDATDLNRSDVPRLRKSARAVPCASANSPPISLGRQMVDSTDGDDGLSTTDENENESGNFNKESIVHYRVVLKQVCFLARYHRNQRHRNKRPRRLRKVSRVTVIKTIDFRFNLDEDEVDNHDHDHSDNDNRDAF